MEEFGKYESDILSIYTLLYEMMSLNEITFEKNIQSKEETVGYKNKNIWAEKARRKLRM
jgi:hypothetical protein